MSQHHDRLSPLSRPSIIDQNEVVRCRSTTQAARRTIRAELTLILVIVLIASWSIYALYKFSVGGSDSIFGLSFSRSSKISQAGEHIALEGDKSMPEEDLDHRRRMIEEILAGQRELHGYMDSGHSDTPRTDKSKLKGDDRNQSYLDRLESRSRFRGYSGTAILVDHPRAAGEKSKILANQLDLSETTDVDPSVADRQPAESKNDFSETVAEFADDQEATTTTSPTVDEETHVDDGAADEQQGSQDESDQKQDEENETVDDDQVAAARDKGKAIDEEVDRMTEPSLGVLSRHANEPLLPENYDRSVVQFDDSPPSSSGLSSASSERRSPAKLAGSSGPVVLFQEPNENQSKRKKLRATSDLQVENNMNPSSVSEANRTTGIQHKEHPRISESADDRSKRSVLINDPSDVGLFLDSLDFGDLAGAQSINSPVEQTSNGSYINKLPRIRPGNHTIRRSDSDYYEGQEDEDGGVDDPSRATIDDLRVELDRIARQQASQEQSPSYHYLSSNDSTLRKLLDHQRLLDDLRYSQVPKPYVLPDETNQTQASRPNFRVENPGADHQTAGSLYTVDHGLLLYPSEDEEHHHKEKSSSMSKKKKKHEKMKHKKKSTVAMKKGGHKKKKHKKEEKKYLKEKKFKGAKKGKKVAKGKGGQGGKKGKKLYKDKGFKKKGFKNVYHKEEFGQKKSYFDEFRDKDFKKKWKKYDDKYNYAQMKKWQAKDVKGAKKMKDSGENHKKYDKSKWKKKYEKHSNEHKASSNKKKKKKESHDFR